MCPQVSLGEADTSLSLAALCLHTQSASHAAEHASRALAAYERLGLPMHAALALLDRVR